MDKKDTIKPAIYGTAAVLFSLPVYYFGMTRYGIKGIAVSLIISVLLQVSVIFYMWNKDSGNKGLSVYGTYFKIFLVSIPLGLCIHFLKQYYFIFPDQPTLLNSLASSIIITLIFGLLLIIFSKLFRIKEMNELMDIITKKIIHHKN